MATNFWKCEDCEYIGEPGEFEKDCPKCGSEDVFPHRMFRCLKCGYEGRDEDFFGEYCAIDYDPILEGWEAECVSCGSPNFEQIK